MSQRGHGNTPCDLRYVFLQTRTRKFLHFRVPRRVYIIKNYTVKWKIKKFLKKLKKKVNDLKSGIIWIRRDEKDYRGLRATVCTNYFF